MLTQTIIGTGSDTGALNRTTKTSSETNDYKRTLTITDMRDEIREGFGGVSYNDYDT